MEARMQRKQRVLRQLRKVIGYGAGKTELPELLFQRGFAAR